MVSAFAIACSLVTSFDGLNEPTAGFVDAGGDSPAPPADSGSGDARSDATAPDAGTMCEGLSPTPFFCEDFDRGRPLDAIFSSVSVTNGAALTVDQAGASVSSPGALSIVLPAATTGGMTAMGVRALPAAFSKAVLELDVRVDAMGDADEHDFVSFYKSGSREVGLEIRPNGVVVVDEDIPVVVDGGPDENKTVTSLVFATEWVHLKWEVAVLDNGRATSVLRADGKQVASFSTSNLPFLGGSLTVGERTIIPLTKPWRTRIDNVVLRLE